MRMDTKSNHQPTLITLRICRQMTFLCTRVDRCGQGVPSHLLLGSNTQHSQSIIPCLALRGVAQAIARSRSIRAKVLLREYFMMLAGPCSGLKVNS